MYKNSLVQQLVELNLKQEDTGALPGQIKIHRNTQVGRVYTYSVM